MFIAALISALLDNTIPGQDISDISALRFLNKQVSDKQCITS